MRRVFKHSVVLALLGLEFGTRHAPFCVFHLDEVVGPWI
jgi:hypothetical protein